MHHRACDPHAPLMNENGREHGEKKGGVTDGYCKKGGWGCPAEHTQEQDEAFVSACVCVDPHVSQRTV